MTSSESNPAFLEGYLAVYDAIGRYIKNEEKLNDFEPFIKKALVMYMRERKSATFVNSMIVALHILVILEEIFPMEEDETILQILVHLILPNSQGAHLLTSLQNAIEKLSTAEALMEAATKLYEESDCTRTFMAKVPLSVEKQLLYTDETIKHERTIHTLSIKCSVAAVIHVFASWRCYDQAVRRAKIIVTVYNFDESSEIGIFVKKASEWTNKEYARIISCRDLGISTIETMRSIRSFKCEYATLGETKAMETLSELK